MSMIATCPYLKFFTFRSQVEIAELEREAQAHPERRARSASSRAT